MIQDKTNTIMVNIPSEIAPLRTVVMCLANPVSIYSLWFVGIDIAYLYQLFNNKFAWYSHLRVREQQKAFIEVLKVNGVEVLLAEPIRYCATQHYPRDIGFAIDDAFFCANTRHRERELKGLQNILPRLSKVVRLESGKIEGGDVIVDDRYVLVGLGEQTNKEGVHCLRRKLEDLGINREVVTMEFTHRGIIHLDTKFSIAAKGIGLIHPRSFQPKSRRWLESHFDLIEATDEEAENGEINVLALSPRKVVLREKSHRIASLLASRGIQPILIDYSEVIKLAGSFRCTTLPIERVEARAGQQSAPPMSGICRDQ